MDIFSWNQTIQCQSKVSHLVYVKWNGLHNLVIRSKYELKKDDVYNQ